jgi:tRNA uridine 5-carbamoylmethylation protein Kti12
MNSKKGKLIMVMGPPASGKSTLAAEVHTELKKKGINSAFVSEAATDYIAEYGVDPYLDQNYLTKILLLSIIFKKKF